MSSKRYSSIDQLRFIAAITVAISHLLISKFGSNINLEIISSIAVEVFFVISGFVLAPQILNIVNSENTIKYKIFLIRRWYRTIPLYVLSLVLTSILLGKFLSLDFIKYLFFIQNFLEIILKIDYFSISWSLSVEEWFYIIFPIFLFYLNKISKIKNKKNIINLSILFIALIFFFRIFNLTDEDWGSNIRRVVIYRLDAIVFGFILFFFKDLIINKFANLTKLIIFIMITTGLTYKILEINASQNSLFFKLIFHYVVALWGSLVVLFFYLLDQYIIRKKLIKINLFLGQISYSIYLFHLMIVYLVTSIKINLPTTIIIFLILQILISTLLYKYFEKPILKLRPSY